jgi:D-alanine-D-alanine ligase
MKISVLTYVEHEGDRGFDPVVGQVAQALRRSGHRVSVVGAHGNLSKLFSSLRRRQPDLVFNLMETFGETQLGLVPLAGFLDLVGLPYTGGGPGEFYIQEDKALAKKLLAFDHIRYPEFAVFSPSADLETAGSLRLPLFVKPLRMDASIGIDAGSLVHSTREMLERVALIHEQVHDAALVEEYIEGRELYVGVLGNQEAQAFPPIEMDFSGLPDGAPHVLGSRAKWDERSPEYQGTRAVVADVAPEVAARLRQTALDACRALRVRDYGRVDMRLTPAGAVYVIEVNASCYLERASEFALAASAAGIDYMTLISRIAELALERHRRAAGEPSPVRRRRRRARVP